MQLYHFTDSRNLWSIKRRGLLSWRKLVDRQIVHHSGSNELSRSLDERDGLDNFVRLCLTDYHPMALVAQEEGRIKELLWLEVDEEVLKFSGECHGRRSSRMRTRISEAGLPRPHES